MHHLAFAVEDGVAGALAEVEEKGIRLIDKAPRKGAEGLNIAFLHPKSTLGVLDRALRKTGISKTVKSSNHKLYKHLKNINS